MVVESLGAFRVVEADSEAFSQPLGGVGYVKHFGDGGAGFKGANGPFESAIVGKVDETLQK